MGKYGGFQRIFVLFAALTVGVRCGNAERDPSPAAEGGHAGAATLGGAASLGGSGGANSGGNPGSGGATVVMGGAASGGKAPINDWQPDFPLGEPGWKNSREPFCDVNQGRVAAAGVFADARGVFAVVGNECVPEGRDLPSCPLEKQLAAGVSLSFNDGNGWRALLDSEVNDIYGLTGFAGGPLVLGQRECPAALFDVEQRTSRCTLTGAGAGGFYDTRSFVANDSLAYSLVGTALFEYRDGSWSRLVEDLPETINALWANDEVVYLAGEYQLYSFAPRGNRELQALPNAPAARYTAVWGFASDDVWFGNSIGQLTHYDGEGFRQGPIPNDGEYPGVVQLWGSEDVLFFRSYMSFGRVTVATAERETLLGDVRNLGFWGTSPGDVFIGVADDEFSETACGAAFFLYFDGDEFHRF
jgi:hypothetical protein